jgi:chromosome segregation ATPase
MILDTVVRKLQEKLLSETAIERLLAAYRRKLEARRAVVPTNDGRLRKRVEDLDRQIDQGAERVLSAPETLVGTLYAKIDRLRIERDRLQAQLDTAGRPVTGSVSQDDRKVEDATKVLRDLREAFKDADPLGVREHLRYLVSKVELQFSHRQAGKRMKNELQGGGIFVRPGLLDPSIMQPILDS